MKVKRTIKCRFCGGRFYPKGIHAHETACELKHQDDEVVLMTGNADKKFKKKTPIEVPNPENADSNTQLASVRSFLQTAIEEAKKYRDHYEDIIAKFNEQIDALEEAEIQLNKD